MTCITSPLYEVFNVYYLTRQSSERRVCLTKMHRYSRFKQTMYDQNEECIVWSKWLQDSTTLLKKDISLTYQVQVAITKSRDIEEECQARLMVQHCHIKLPFSLTIQKERRPSANYCLTCYHFCVESHCQH